MIRIEQVTKVYEGGGASVTALDDVSLVATRARSSGSSDAAGRARRRCCAASTCSSAPPAGRIILDGTDLSTLTDKQLRGYRRRIGIVFQQFNLLHSRTVAGNVAFPLQVAKWSRRDREARIGELLEIVGLTDKAESYPSQLSGGQKQRVGIARALAARA